MKKERFLRSNKPRSDKKVKPLRQMKVVIRNSRLIVRKCYKIPRTAQMSGVAKAQAVILRLTLAHIDIPVLDTLDHMSLHPKDIRFRPEAQRLMKIVRM